MGVLYRKPDSHSESMKCDYHNVQILIYAVPIGQYFSGYRLDKEFKKPLSQMNATVNNEK